MEKQFMEREQEMAAKHKQELLLLTQKMELLRSSRSSSSSESVRSETSSTKRREKVESWNTVDFTSSVRKKIQSNTALNAHSNPFITNGTTPVSKPLMVNQDSVDTQQHVSQFPTYDSNFISKSGLAARNVMGKRLPHFDGDPMKWPGFVSQFKTSTQVCELTEAENLVRLDESITRNARVAVEGLLYLPENVPMIMEVLRKLFGLHPSQQCGYPHETCIYERLFMESFLRNSLLIRCPVNSKWNGLTTDLNWNNVKTLKR